MPVRDKPTLKGYFNAGDVPSESNYADLIDTMGDGDMQKSVYDPNNDGKVANADAVPWAGVTGKPATFTPSSHQHAGGDITSAVANSNALGGVAANRFVQGQNTTRTVDLSGQSMNDALPAGFYNGSSTLGAPTADWWHIFHGRHNNEDPLHNYAVDIVCSFWSDDLRFRRVQDGAVGTWRQIHHTGAEIINSNDARIGGGLYVGGVGTDPPVGRIIASADMVTPAIYIMNGATQVGELTASDSTWFRLNQNTPKDIYTPRMFRADGGLCSGSTSTTGGKIASTSDIICGNNLINVGNLVSFKNSSYYTGYPLTPLTSQLTSASWNGIARSTTAKTLIDLSTVFGAPAGIKAVLLRVAVRDSGSLGTECWITFSPNNSANSGLAIGCGGIANDMYSRGSLLVPCDANGDIYFQTLASGANTLDVWLEIWGYCI